MNDGGEIKHGKILRLLQIEIGVVLNDLWCRILRVVQTGNSLTGHGFCNSFTGKGFGIKSYLTTY